MANFYKQIIKMLKISSFFTARQSSIFATRLANSGAPIIQAASLGT